MKFKCLGNSGLRVSELCFGVMTFGQAWGWGASKEDSREMFTHYVDAGGNFFDTANFYTDGESERYLGEFLGANRDRYVIGTKYTLTTNPQDPNASGNHRKNLMQSLEASLSRLGTDYIDVYWVHAYDRFTPIEETMRALDDAVRSGKVRYVGVSDFPAWMVARAQTIAELKNWSPFIGLQIEYSLIERTVERELLPMAQALNLGLTAWSPLGQGILAGKFTRTNKEQSSRGVENSRRMTEKNISIARELDSLADSIGASSAATALAWVQAQGAIPILGARTLEQLQDNLTCLEVELSEDICERLDALSAVGLGFPHDFLQSDRMQQIVYGDRGPDIS